MLRRTLSPGDVIRVDGPCDILIHRRKGRLVASFDAPHKTRVTHRKKQRRVDISRKRRSN
jgi:hypothetical protein